MDERHGGARAEVGSSTTSAKDAQSDPLTRPPEEAAGCPRCREGAATPRPRHIRRDAERDEVRQALKRRLARIEGQIRGISAMVEDGRYCVDILTQLAAVQQALRKVSRTLLEDHMSHCVEEAFSSGDPAEKERVSQEIADLMFKYSR